MILHNQLIRRKGSVDMNPKLHQTEAQLKRSTTTVLNEVVSVATDGTFTLILGIRESDIRTTSVTHYWSQNWPSTNTLLMIPYSTRRASTCMFWLNKNKTAEWWLVLFVNSIHFFDVKILKAVAVMICSQLLEPQASMGILWSCADFVKNAANLSLDESETCQRWRKPLQLIAHHWNSMKQKIKILPHFFAAIISVLACIICTKVTSASTRQTGSTLSST